MKILVTGGAGFIGSHVVNALLDDLHTVSVIDKLNNENQVNIDRRARTYIMDLRENADSVLGKERPDIVIHNAAQINIRYSIDDPVFDAEQNIVTSLALFNACKKYGVKKVIFASSGGSVYGQPSKLPADESTPLDPMSPYAICKATIEDYLRFHQRMGSFDYIALRYANVYGPRQNPKGEAGIIAVFVDKILHKERPEIFATGNPTRDYIYVSDVVAANQSAVKYEGSYHAFNIGTGKETGVTEISALITGMMGAEEPTYNPRQTYNDIQRICLDCSLARQELNWEPKVRLEDGVRKTIEWFKNYQR